jgi:hypothetical protein
VLLNLLEDIGPVSQLEGHAPVRCQVLLYLLLEAKQLLKGLSFDQLLRLLLKLDFFLTLLK